MDPFLRSILIGSAISGVGSAVGGYISSRAAQPYRESMSDLVSGISETSKVRQSLVRDLLQGYTGEQTNSPLVSLINSGLLNYYRPEDVGGSPEYIAAKQNIAQSYQETSGDILTALASRGAIRSGATQASLEKLGAARLTKEREAYIYLSELRSKQIQAAVDAAIRIITGDDETEEAINATQNQITDATGTGNPIANAATNIGNAIVTRAITGTTPTVPPVVPPPVTSTIIPPPVEDVGSIVTAGTEPIISGTGGVTTPTTGTSITDLTTEMSDIAAPVTSGITDITGPTAFEMGGEIGLPVAPATPAANSYFGINSILGNILSPIAMAAALLYFTGAFKRRGQYNTPQQSTKEAMEIAGMSGVQVNEQEVSDFFNQMSFESGGARRAGDWQGVINAYYNVPEVKTMINQRFGGLPSWLTKIQAAWGEYWLRPENVSIMSIGGGA